MKFSKIFAVLFLIVLFSESLYSQQRPKLVVGIVVDQMRFDYLYKYQPYFGEGGFRRLMNEGSNFTFAHYNYELTSTALGHSSIYTGTTPFYHGIIGNNFFDKKLGKMIYCVDDPAEKSVGSDNSSGAKSPRRLLTTTITDQLKLATNGHAKVISVSLKDRSAILPGGHNPDGAFWYDGKTGNFVTSTYYMKELPKWVKDFNERKLVDKYLAGGWNLSRPETDYRYLNSADESSYEKDLFNEGKTSFPHSFSALKETDRYGEFENTPYGNSIVAELAEAALKNENLGKGRETDFLAVSFSSTDHIGHEYGNYSYELQDTYIKLDASIAELLTALDKQVGKGNYLLFLTADHAGMPTPSYMKDNKFPTGGLNSQASLDSLKSFAHRLCGDENLIQNYSNKQLFFDRTVIRNKGLSLSEVEKAFAEYLRDTFPQIASIFTRDYLETQTAVRIPASYIINGFNPSISGDVAFNLRSSYLPTFQEKGTTHGSSYSYDTHIPMFFYGWHVPVQTVNEPVYIVDIAVTIANLLKINEPSAAIGIPILKGVK